MSRGRRLPLVLPTHQRTMILEMLDDWAEATRGAGASRRASRRGRTLPRGASRRGGFFSSRGPDPAGGMQVTAGLTSTPVSPIRVARLAERIARWDLEARGVEAWWA